MPASELGPWGRIYFRIGVDKAHYSLEALGAFLKTWAAMGLVTPRGSLKRRAVIGLIGQVMYDFLVEEGDLIESGGSVTMHRWEWYQAPLEQNRRRQAVHRSSPAVDNVTERDRNVTVTGSSRDVSSSPSDSLDVGTTNEEERPSAFMPDSDDRDSLDRFHELTGLRPWGKRSGSWLKELQATHGTVNVDAALEVEHKADPSGRDLLSRTAARLERQAERVATAKAKEPKPVDPLQAQIRESLVASGRYDPVPESDLSPEAVAAGRAALEALRKGRPANLQRGGGLQRVGAVVSSGQGAPSGLSLTVGEGSDR